MEKRRFNTALFDMDGVLFDSMPGHVYAYVEALKPHGIHFTPEIVYEHEGMKGVTTIKTVAEKLLGHELSLEEAEKLYEEKCRIFRSLPPVEKIPGVEHLMRTMKEAGWNICVVTGSGQRSMLDKLVEEFPGLLTTDRIVSCFDYNRGKPAPDPYLEGLRRTGAKAEETVVIENAPLGVRAGRAAGIYTIAVNTGPLNDDIFRSVDASFVCHTMAEAENHLFSSSKTEEKR